MDSPITNKTQLKYGSGLVVYLHVGALQRSDLEMKLNTTSSPSRLDENIHSYWHGHRQKPLRTLKDCRLRETILKA